MKVCLAFVVALFAMLWVGAASAHQVGLSKGDYTATTDALDISLTFARRDAAVVLPSADTDHDGELSAAEIAAAASAPAGSALATEGATLLRVTRDGAACDLERVGVKPDQDGIALELRTKGCASGAFSVDHGPLFETLSSGHRHAVVVHKADGTTTDTLLYAGAATLAVASPGGGAVAEPAEDRTTVALRYIWLGITHILGGTDHVVFLLGLLLIGGKFRQILAMVTAFTISHSITLGLAVTGVLAPSPMYVEPLIALSVAYVGVENFIVKDASKRWRITALFGLVHGFGFAGALGEVGIPKEHVPLALATFNIGVEIGQLLIIGLAFPLFAYLRKIDWVQKKGVRFASMAVIAAGLFWFVSRVFPSS